MVIFAIPFSPFNHLAASKGVRVRSNNPVFMRSNSWSVKGCSPIAAKLF
jgi:hypothetical protein